jgi:hypothetical protein
MIVTTQSYPNPAWLTTIFSQYLVGNYHQFILDGNIEDCFLSPDVFKDGTAHTPGDLLPFRELLINTLLRKNFTMVFYYATTTGLLVYSKIDNKVDQSFPQKIEDHGLVISQFRDFLDKAIEESSNDIPASRDLIQNRNMEAFRKIDKCLKKGWLGDKSEKVKIATVIDSLDKIISSQKDRTSQHLTEQLKGWGTNLDIKKTGNLSIFLF